MPKNDECQYNSSFAASFITADLEPLWIWWGPVEDLESVSFGEAELCVVLRLEGVESHHDVEHVLRHAVGVRVVYLLLGVVRGEPANLETGES